MKKRIHYIIVLCCLFNLKIYAQVKSKGGGILAPTPPMGWMTWNYFADNINEKDIMEMADAMIHNGFLSAGYNYVFIDDGWQGGRDNKNNIIADPRKFPSGIKALADYLHGKGLKLGMYSDAALLTCAGYTASLGFEEQDAKVFASWGVDYLKYDYCGAPNEMEIAKQRYKIMADALRKSDRDIIFGVCEWGGRKPWLWAAQAGGQLWRTTNDVRDKWKRRSPAEGGEGILNIMDLTASLDQYAGPGHWNDMDMLVVGLKGKKGPSGDLGGTGCTNTEYQSQMSLWSIMASPLAATDDLRNMDAETKRILLNKEVIAINQDLLGKQAVRKIDNDTWTVLLKLLQNGDYALAILNRTEITQRAVYDFTSFGLNGPYQIRDLWQHKAIGKGSKWRGSVDAHETKLFRLSKMAY